jgi:hypothetical protein
VLKATKIKKDFHFNPLRRKIFKTEIQVNINGCFISELFCNSDELSILKVEIPPASEIQISQIIFN